MWTQTLENITLINNVLLILFFVVFGIVFWKEHKDSKSPIVWTDLLLDKKENRLSLTKLGQFMGIAMSSWIVIFLTQKLSPDQVVSIFPWVFGTWLAFLLASTGVKFMSNVKEIENRKKTENEDSQPTS